VAGIPINKTAQTNKQRLITFLNRVLHAILAQISLFKPFYLGQSELKILVKKQNPYIGYLNPPIL
jgi:hypothetical protein